MCSECQVKSADAGWLKRVAARVALVSLDKLLSYSFVFFVTGLWRFLLLLRWLTQKTLQDG